MVTATFSKQSSNLSALGAAMGSFDRLLDVSNENNWSSKEEKESDSAAFLKSQHDRIAAIEGGFMKATEHILPSSSSASTVTELAELCRLVQEANREKMLILKTRLKSMGCNSQFLESDEALLSPNTPSPNIFWSIGGPLERVVEGDVETEGTITPSSLLHPSPFSSATKRKNSISPATPTMQSMSFSAGTNSLLQNMTPNGSFRKSPSPYRTYSGRRQSNFEGFQEEDDMITLDTHSTTPATRRQSSIGVRGSPQSEEKSYFMTRMECVLDRVDESVMESRPSDEITTSTWKSVATKNSFPQDNGTEVDDGYTAEDDSTDVVATQIASQTIKKSTTRDFSQAKTNLNQHTPKAKTPTTILVDTAAPSPAHTNITMDATMLNETMASLSVFPDDEISSTVTPILDRYRLDPDDNSIGIKVVPNKRGSSRQQNPIISEILPEEEAYHGPTFYTQEDGFTSPKGIPGTVSARKKKQYRKTPLPKKKLEDDTLSTTWDENYNPNAPSTMSSDKDHSNPKLNSVFGSFSVPPLRAASFEPKRTPTRSKAKSLSGSETKSSTPLSDKFLQRNYPASPLLHANEKVDIETVAPSSARSSLSERFELESVPMGKWIEKITMAEYEGAPEIVQNHVRRDEANKAIDMIEDFLTSSLQSDPSSSLEFDEMQGYEALGSSFPSLKKSKSVLMSLCHWRRLLMHRDDYGMRFVVNQFAS